MYRSDSLKGYVWNTLLEMGFVKFFPLIFSSAHSISTCLLSDTTYFTGTDFMIMRWVRIICKMPIIMSLTKVGRQFPCVLCSYLKRGIACRPPIKLATKLTSICSHA